MRPFITLLLFFTLAGSLARPVSAQDGEKKSTHVEFLRDIAPILDRSGCSVAECHGKFGGRGGLQISLLTLSPEDDFAPLVYGARGRRINFTAPEKSLLLLKATGKVMHRGGMRFAEDSPQYRQILRWIKQGAPFEDDDPRLTSLVLKPNKVALTKVGQIQQVRAIAKFTDGSTRDVTGQTVFRTTNPAVLSVSLDGKVVGTRWGGAAIQGRYLGSIAASFFTLPQERKGKYPAIAVSNPIDKFVFANLKGMNIVPSDVSGEEEFLRRVTLDTLGRLPASDEIAAFTADKSGDKRARKIDELLEKPEAADLRALQVSDLLRVHPRRLGDGSLGERAAVLFYDWILKSAQDNKPWDKFVHELITARGSTYQNGPANFFRIERGANDRMENIGQAFLGVRMSCARCHKHPFDRWTTDDYWNFAAFCGKVGIRGGKLKDENVVVLANNDQVRNESVTGRNRGQIAPPTFLGEKEPAPLSQDMVQEFADWITKPENPFFARATVNRVWSYYFAKGIINPVDDMRATTPESVPGLLDALAQELIQHNYDIKYMTKLILNSRTYQLSSASNRSNELDDTFFSRAMPRPMPPQVLLDVINQASGAHENFGNWPERSKATQAALPVGNYFLDAFGQSHREFLADIDPKLEPNLVQTLHMINSDYIDRKARDGDVVKQIVKDAPTEEALVRSLFLRTFSRAPSTSETYRAVAILKTIPDKKEAAADLLWALLSSREFYFNH